LSKANSENVTFVNGCSLNILGKTFLQFIIGTEAFHFEAHVIEDLTYDVVIGRDFLQYFRSRIDFENDVFTFSREENYLPFCDVLVMMLKMIVVILHVPFMLIFHLRFHGSLKLLSQRN